MSNRNIISKRLIMSIVIIIMGILMITILPFIIPGMLEEMEASEKIRNDQIYAEFEPQEKQVETTLRTMSWSYPFWVAFTILAGFILLFVVKPYYKEEKWTKPIVLMSFFIPSVAGAYMITTYYHFLGFEAGFSLGFLYLFIGMIGYFSVLLIDLESNKQKYLYFWIYFMLGLIAAEAWINGITTHVIIEGKPAIPFYTFDVYMLYITRLINWFAIFLLVLSVYYISFGKKIGWYLAILSSLSISTIGFIMQTVRTGTHDFLYQGLMGIALVLTLLIPSVRKNFIKK